MGLIRLLLAVCVVVSHGGSAFGASPIDGNVAVALFFIVSGFYMAVALDRKYGFSGLGLRDFYCSRLLRIFPLYLLVLAITAVLSMDRIGTLLAFEDGGTIAALTLLNLGLVGSEWLSFLTLGAADELIYGGGTLTGDNANAWMMLPQAWTLGLELLFYALCPFLLRSLPILLGAFAVSIAIRVGVSGFGDLWQVRFFPSVLCLFLAGSIAYRLYQAVLPIQVLWRIALICSAVTLPIWLGIVLFAQNPAVQALLPLGGREVYLLLPCLLPVLFHWTKKNAVDSAIGQLSYPVYLVHWAVVLAIGATGLGAAEGAAITLISLVAAAIVAFALEAPLDRFRHAWFPGDKGRQG